jgi:hypothetical protein
MRLDTRRALEAVYDDKTLAPGAREARKQAALADMRFERPAYAGGEDWVMGAWWSRVPTPAGSR